VSVRVLLVDDEEVPRRLLAAELSSAGFDVSEAADGLEGLGLFEELDPDVVVTDKNMPRANGLELLSAIRERSDTPVIVLTAYGSVDSAVAAMKSGAVDYLSSDAVEIDQIVDLVREATGRISKHDLARRMEHAFPGRSPLANRLRRRMRVFAPLDSPVFLQGAAGTPKCDIARALHAAGSTAGGSLLEIAASELRPQLLHQHAAVHVEDVESLPRTVLPAVLEAMQEEGAARILASSALALEDARLEREGEDLLRPFVIDVPILSDHAGDLAVIAERSLAAVGASIEREGLSLTRAALERLQQERWPGNEAELHGVLQRAAILSAGHAIGSEAVDQALDEARASVSRIRELKRSREREQLIAALREADGVVSRASRILRLNRSAVYRLMDKYGLERERRS